MRSANYHERVTALQEKCQPVFARTTAESSGLTMSESLDLTVAYEEFRAEVFVLKRAIITNEVLW